MPNNDFSRKWHAHILDRAAFFRKLWLDFRLPEDKNNARDSIRMARNIRLNIRRMTITSTILSRAN